MLPGVMFYLYKIITELQGRLKTVEDSNTQYIGHVLSLDKYY